MITNLLATILVSVVTNWSLVYENPPLSVWDIPLNTPLPSDFFKRKVDGKLLGKDGIVVKVTEIKFIYDGQERISRIEEPQEKIIMRFHEKEPELIWDEPIRQKIKQGD